MKTIAAIDTAYGGQSLLFKRIAFVGLAWR
jgi:hypothetical protein